VASIAATAVTVAEAAVTTRAATPVAAILATVVAVVITGLTYQYLIGTYSLITFAIKYHMRE